MKKIAFLGWKNCVELTSGDFRIVVTTSVGPRVIGGFVGKSRRNLFHTDKRLAGKSGGEKWVNYGGHRLWHSPEDPVRTYMPDNSPVEALPLKNGGISFAAREPELTGIAKNLSIYPEDGGSFRVEHTLENRGLWPVELAPWAISVMAPGGTAVLPQNPEQKGLLPTRFFAVWPYTDMNDPRIHWGKHFILVKQDSSPGIRPMKIGSACREGFLAYINHGFAFVKSFIHDDKKHYPDNGCSAEIYTCREMLEAETLGALTRLNPGGKIRHTERWNAFPVQSDAASEEAADTLLKNFRARRSVRNG